VADEDRGAEPGLTDGVADEADDVLQGMGELVG
jgi:hypothetical protein